MSKNNWKSKEPESYVNISSRKFSDFCRCRDFSIEQGIEKLIDFWESMHRICIFCNGLVVDGVCVNCGRSDDQEYELMVTEVHKNAKRM